MVDNGRNSQKKRVVIRLLVILHVRTVKHSAEIGQLSVGMVGKSVKVAAICTQKVAEKSVN